MPDHAFGEEASEPAGYVGEILSRLLALDDQLRLVGIAEVEIDLADHLDEVPVHILVCTFSNPSVNAGIASGSSIYPAVQNLMLAARALGLGTALTTIHRQRQDEIRELLGIPDTVETAALIPVGWPMGRFGEGRRLPTSHVTYYDTWGEKRDAK